MLTATSRQAEIAACLDSLGLPPDSSRYGYRPHHQQPLFGRHASPCPNAEALATSTFQLPVYPGLPEATVEWMAARIAVIACGGTTP